MNIRINEYNDRLKRKLMMCCTNVRTYKVILSKYQLLSCSVYTPILQNWCVFIKLGAQIQLQALAGPGRGVVPPKGCLLKAHFTTMMLFPDQTRAWNADRNGRGASKLLLNFKNQNHFFGRFCTSTWVCLGGTHHTSDYSTGSQVKHELQP